MLYFSVRFAAIAEPSKQDWHGVVDTDMWWENRFGYVPTL